MKKKSFFTALFLVGCIALSLVYAYNFNNKDMNIAHAIRQNNSIEVIKTMISNMKDSLEIDTDLLPDIITQVEAYTHSLDNAGDKALLHSMLAEMYQVYYNKNSWQFNSRTPVAGYIPDDIREWTGNQFNEKIKSELEASLTPATVLQSIPAAQYSELFTPGEDAVELRPTLYDFLAYRALAIQPSDDLYKELIRFREGQGNDKATLLAKLAFLNTQFRDTEQYQQELDQLLEEYKDKDISVEIINTKLMTSFLGRVKVPDMDSVKRMEYNLAKETIRKFPDYERINVIKNKLNDLEKPFLTMEAPATVYPGGNLEIDLTYQNITSVDITIYKPAISFTDPAFTSVSFMKDKEKFGQPVKKETVQLTVSEPWKTEKQQVQITVPEKGIYYCVISANTDDLVAHAILSVTELAAVFRSSPSNGEKEILITDFRTGKPLPDVDVEYYYRESKEFTKAGSVKTNEIGMAILPSSDTKIRAFRAIKPDDQGMLLTAISNYGESADNFTIDQTVTLFTDRGIYRPGQTVYFKGIAFRNNSDPVVIPGHSFEVIFRDANGKEIGKKSFRSNEFGSFHGEFTIPAQGLNGNFTLNCGNNSAYIQVEEYKRPTFTIEMSPTEKEVAIGDIVTINGNAKTFSGVALQAGEVTYRVNRRAYLFRIMKSSQYQMTNQVTEGKTNVMADGTFSFTIPTGENSESGKFPPFYIYDISVTVTDSKGESQESNTTFSAGKSGFNLSLNGINYNLEKNKTAVSISAYTYNGEKTVVKGTYRLIRLEQPDNRKPAEDKEVVLTGAFETDKDLPSTVFSGVNTGLYKLVAEAIDSRGNTVQGEATFILYSKTDKRPPAFAHVWMENDDQKEYTPGETIEFVFGTADKDAYILYEIYNNEGYIKQEIIRLNNGKRTFRVPFSATYDPGVVVGFTLIKEGKLYSSHTQFRKKQPDRSLNIRPVTFRDRLLPGQNETWKFRITDADSIPASAEMLAYMYDLSLDKISPFDLNFYLRSRGYLFTRYFMEGSGMQSNYNSTSRNDKEQLPVKEYSYDQLDWQGVLDLISPYRNIRIRGGVMAKSYAGGELRMSSATVAESMDDVSAAQVQSVDAYAGRGNIDSSAEIPSSPVRTNFNETAFFYPALLTDKEGNLSISFTVPESNTTWKLQAFAHTKEMKYGILKEQTVTQKPLMVLPNVPRFFRKGDRVILTSQIMNQSENPVNGTIRLVLFDPYTEEIIQESDKMQSFSLREKQTGTVQWDWLVPIDKEIIGIRYVADSNVASDGEQHIVPVISDEILVTESTPFYLGNGEIKAVTIPGMPSGAKSFAMTLELSGNPVWYAVQALPAITNPENESAISWFASYFSNTLATYIVRSHPRLESVIRNWTLSGGNAQTLWSNLQTNEELKNILLQETPWVLEAENETEQKQRLALLFDINRATSQKEIALQSLANLQLESGAWGWFKGFYPNRNITTEILRGMARLVELQATQFGEQEKMMQIKALNFLDKEIQKEYEALSKNSNDLKNYTPSPFILDYLYVRSHYRDIPESGDAREAFRFFTAQAEKQWEKASLYGKAETAKLLYRNGNKSTAGKIANWFRKTSRMSEELGMYWPNNRRERNFFRSPIDTHVMIMSMLNEVDRKATETDRMKQWLLNQKRVQKWESTPATTDAIYGILLTGSDWLTDNKPVTIDWAGERFSSEEGENITGYLKKTIKTVRIATEPTTLNISNPGDSPAWGALYRQYYQVIDQVESGGGDLSVDKKLFIETNSGQSRQLTPVENNRLKVGDKVIVRLTIRTNTEMEYVYLKDLRAGCFEPSAQLSGLKYSDNLLYYQSPKDLSENFFFERLPAGTYVLEYSSYVSRAGEYSGGLSTIQCLYAPEFVSHTKGDRIVVTE